MARPCNGIAGAGRHQLLAYEPAPATLAVGQGREADEPTAEYGYAPASATNRIAEAADHSGRHPAQGRDGDHWRRTRPARRRASRTRPRHPAGRPPHRDDHRIGGPSRALVIRRPLTGLSRIQPRRSFRRSPGPHSPTPSTAPGRGSTHGRPRHRPPPRASAEAPCSCPPPRSAASPRMP